jgi:hypothetical protein
MMAFSSAGGIVGALVLAVITLLYGCLGRHLDPGLRLDRMRPRKWDDWRRYLNSCRHDKGHRSGRIRSPGVLAARSASI